MYITLVNLYNMIVAMNKNVDSVLGTADNTRKKYFILILWQRDTYSKIL